MPERIQRPIVRRVLLHINIRLEREREWDLAHVLRERDREMAARVVVPKEDISNSLPRSNEGREYRNREERKKKTKKQKKKTTISSTHITRRTHTLPAISPGNHAWIIPSM
jgi:hypothetical protein